MKKLVSAALFFLLLLPFPAFAGDGEDIIYKSATEYDYPPFSVTTSGEADGFSVDLLKAVAEEAGIKVEFKIGQWDDIKEELKEGKLDILPLVGFSEERDEYFDFSVPYIVMHGNIFVRKDNTSIKSESDLFGKEIIVMQGDTANEYAVEMGFTDNLITTATTEEAFRLLSSGKHDAVLAQGLVGEKLINDLNLKNIVAVTELENDGVTRSKINLKGFEQKFCFAVKEGDNQLLFKLNEGLAIVSENGTYNRLYEKWFPFLIEKRPIPFWDILTLSAYILIPIIIILLLLSLLIVRREVKRKTVALMNANRDKTELENKLRDQHRLESLGVLAGGVAHEINNPVNGILNYSQLILDTQGSPDDVQEYAREIIHESNRVSTIVRNLLHFSRQEKQAYSNARPEDIINNTISLISTIIKNDQITLCIDIEQDLPDIKCRSQQIQQVLMNLLTNARDSLNEKYPGYNEDKLITIKCRLVMREDAKWVRITIEDSGGGIPQSIHERIFEPFYTTKSKDKGTGLGLSISYGIVKEHKGALSFETKEGEYTRFYLDLPVDNGWSLEPQE